MVDRARPADRGHAPLRWDISGGDDGTTYRLTHAAIGRDAELASAWHALLLQLDMYLAAGQLVPADPERWVDEYAAALT